MKIVISRVLLKLGHSVTKEVSKSRTQKFGFVSLLIKMLPSLLQWQIMNWTSLPTSILLPFLMKLWIFRFGCQYGIGVLGEMVPDRQPLLQIPFLHFGMWLHYQHVQHGVWSIEGLPHYSRFFVLTHSSIGVILKMHSLGGHRPALL